MRERSMMGILGKRWRDQRASILTGALFALLPVLLGATPATNRAELATQDVRFHLRGRRRTTARIVLAMIDDETLEAWPEPLAFWGKRFAAGIRRARAAGATSVGFDIVPVIVARGEPEFGRALAEGGVVLSYTGTQRPSAALAYASAEQAQNLGYIDLPRQPDEEVRYVSLQVRDPTGNIPSFVSLLSRRSHSGPWNTSGNLLINYVAGPGTFPRIRFQDLANGTLTGSTRAQLRGATVLIGAAYTGANDLHRAPFGQYDGTEILAHALATLVDGRSFRTLTPGASILIACGLGLSCAIVFAFLPLGWGAGLALLLSAAWLEFSGYAFSRDWLLPTAGPLLSVWLAWVGHYTVRSAEEARHRRTVQKLFGQHVSGTVVRRLLSDPQWARLGGERRELTVLFSDIRQFTDLSERTEPAAVVELLNEYLPEMEACVFRHGGTLDKYIGDAVMAFWNAPELQPDHALRALTAAQDMQSALRELNARWEAAGKPQLVIGIGINTGPVVVGHVGSERFKSYTAIGSTVNQAARLESATKELGAEILIGEETYHHVGLHLPMRVHVISVKGVEEPLRVYQPVKNPETAALPCNRVQQRVSRSDASAEVDA